jgi:hypothetical protein
MKKNSHFLKELSSKKSKGKALNFYSYFDILVPGESAKGENPIQTSNFLHFFIQNDKKILKKIEEFLKS